MISHAYLLCGGSKESRLAKVRIQAAAIIGGERTAQLIAEDACEDFILLSPEGATSSYTVAQMDELSSSLKLRPFASERRVFVIDDAEALTTPCQNKLLKNLEEPPGNSVIFLLTGSPMSLLATVRSRLTVTRLDEVSELPDEHVYEEAKDILSSMLFRDTPYFEIAARLDAFKDNPKELIDAMLLFLREMRVGRRAPALLNLAADEVPASKIKDSHDLIIAHAINEAERVSLAVNMGRNVKYALHDMILRMRMK